MVIISQVGDLIEVFMNNMICVFCIVFPLTGLSSNHKEGPRRP